MTGAAAETGFDAIARAAAAYGLDLSGFHPGPDDRAPETCRTLLLLGSAGPALWRAFAPSPERADGAPDPLDRWSRRVIGGLADRFGAEALFPFDGPPWRPFLDWAMRAEPVWISPVGMAVHADKGLWASWRGALALSRRLDLPPRPAAARPCDACEGRPCLTACPVGALAAGAYDVAACVGHVSAPAGADCLGAGCAARRACPVGRDRAHLPDQARFHMEVFLRSNRAGGPKG